MKEKLKKSLKLQKRTIRKLDVRSGLRGGGKTGDSAVVCDYDTINDCVTFDCDTVPVSTVYLCDPFPGKK